MIRLTKTARAVSTAGCLMLAGAFAVTVLADQPASAQMPMNHGQMNQGGMSGHTGHPAPSASAGEAPSTAAFKAANDKMHKAMALPYTGDADLDFVNGMIPHHEGAVEMAKIVLLYGKDPDIRRLAEAIVKAQEEEIAFMSAWRTKHTPPK